MSKRSSIFRAALAAIGIGTQDADKAERVFTTLDSAGDDDEPMGDSARVLRSIDERLKKIEAKDEARERKEREEEEKRTKDAAAARKREEDEKKTRDAEEERKRKEREEAESKDTIIEAEGPGVTLSLGKVYTGDALTEIRARAEILAPGLQMPTSDALKGNGGRVLAGFMRQALQARYTKDSAGKDMVNTFLLGQNVDGLKGVALLGAFNGAAELVRVRNNQSLRLGGASTPTTDRSHVGPNDFGRVVSPAEINKQNRELREKQRQAGA